VSGSQIGAPLLTLRRPASESLSEIALGSFLCAWAFGAIAYFAYLAGVFQPLLSWSVAAGEVVLAHVGWGFGIAVPTVLGFYVIVTGGQLLGSPSESATRRALGGVALLLFVAFVPALLLMVVACLHDPTLVGALFIVLPSYGLMLFLTVQLGGFVFDPEARVAAALVSREWAKGRVKALSLRSRRSPISVAVVNVLIATVLGSVVSLAMDGPDALRWWPVVHLIVAVTLTFAALGAVRLTHISRDRSAFILVWMTVGGLYLTVIVFILQLWLDDTGRQGGATGLFAVALFLLLSTFWARSRKRRILLDWSIQGAATRSAGRFTARRLAKSVDEIARLTPAAEVPPSPLTRLRRILMRRRGAPGTPG
jgi:hypothetical protein